ncbi:MAG: hypothetical protein ABI036_04765 [Fibrobacteria bacterium]
MGFGLGGSVSVPKVEVPKVEVPKVEIPKVNVAGAVSGAAAGLAGAVSGAAAGVAAGAKAAVGGVVGGALGAVGKVAASLAGVAGGLAEVAVSFKGASVDFAMEPHMVLDANASYGDTQFEKGPVWIRVDLTPEKAQENTETLHLRSDDGAFDGKKKINEFSDKSEDTVDVLFEDAPMDQTYSLDVIDEKGVAHSMFAGIPYGDLRNTKNRF